MSTQLSILVSRLIAHVCEFNIPIYHPWAMNILRKNKKSRVPVPSHLKGVYGVDLSSHAWYCCEDYIISTGTIGYLLMKPQGHVFGFNNILFETGRYAL
jgi:hypothetical protein